MPTKHEPLTSQEFRAWLKKQPANRTFNYMDNARCLFASCIKEVKGIKDVSCGSNYYRLDNSEDTYPLPKPYHVKLSNAISADYFPKDNYGCSQLQVAKVRKLFNIKP